MSSSHSGYARADNDWYCEPSWCAENLLDAVTFDGAIHDPCAGMGTIVDAARGRGIAATGADIADRANGRFEVLDFFSDERVYANVVTDPPYRYARDVLLHAALHVVPGGRVAVLVRIPFLNSQRRTRLFDPRWCDQVLIHSRRPSIPPGHKLLELGEGMRGGGKSDYCWVVFRPGREPTAPTAIQWLAP